MRKKELEERINKLERELMSLRGRVHNDLMISVLKDKVCTKDDPVATYFGVMHVDCSIKEVLQSILKKMGVRLKVRDSKYEVILEEIPKSPKGTEDYVDQLIVENRKNTNIN